MNKIIKSVPQNINLSGDADQTVEGQTWLRLFSAVVNLIKKTTYIFPKSSLKFPDSYTPKNGIDKIF